MKKTKPIKFESFMGFALTGAKKKGDMVVIGFQFNIDDGLEEFRKTSMAQHVLDDFVYPEIFRRIKEGVIQPVFRVNKAHVLMYSDYSRNDVLLNDEVKIKSNVKFAPNKVFKKGDEVKQGDIVDVLGLYPNQKNDPNAAHIMLMKFDGNWKFAADMIFDREKVRKRFSSADSFLQSAQINLQKKLWNPFIDNLFSVTELTAQSILLLRHYGKYSLKQSHEKTFLLFKGYCDTGNMPIKFFEHYKKMYELRKKARYLQGVHGKRFTIKKSDAEKYLLTTKEMMNHTNILLKGIDFRRKPKDGEYIDLGISN